MEVSLHVIKMKQIIQLLAPSKSWDSPVSVVTGIDCKWFKSRQEQKKFLSSPKRQLPADTHWVLGLVPRGKEAGA